jgi:hypothetical protein
MATWYCDVSTNQQNGVNFPGQPGVGTITNLPGTLNNSLFEGPPWIIATYTWVGTEAANDLINIAILPAGVVVDTGGHVSSGLTAPATTLTLAIGDNDLGNQSNLPVPNAAALISNTSFVAPTWVSGTTYCPGNVVVDANSTPANLTYTCVAATSGTTAPHSAANTVWMPNSQRYSNSISCAAASGNVAFSGGTQAYGGPASLIPYSTAPNSVPLNLTAAQIANQPYVIQNDCWLQALILTANATVANAVSVFRVFVNAGN